MVLSLNLKAPLTIGFEFQLLITRYGHIVGTKNASTRIS